MLVMQISPFHRIKTRQRFPLLLQSVAELSAGDGPRDNLGPFLFVGLVLDGAADIDGGEPAAERRVRLT